MQATGDDEQKLTQIADICRWYATAGPPTAPRQAAALAELAHLTAGHTTLLAQYAGQLLNHPTPAPDPAARNRAIQLCITAGADMTLMPLTECPLGRSPEFPTRLTLNLLRLVMICHGPCRRVVVVL